MYVLVANGGPFVPPLRDFSRGQCLLGGLVVGVGVCVVSSIEEDEEGDEDEDEREEERCHMDQCVFFVSFDEALRHP